MDANTYFANQNLDKYQSGYTLEEAAEEMAQEMISDPTSELYPWTSKNVYEAITEMTSKGCDRIAAAHADDRALATAVREVVLSYWFEFAKKLAIEELEG